MPDKQNIEQELVDLGWQNMRERLDEAMPVGVKPIADKRRTVGWWLIAAALLLLLSIPTCWYLDGLDQASQPIVTNPEEISDPDETVAKSKISTDVNQKEGEILNETTTTNQNQLNELKSTSTLPSVSDNSNQNRLVGDVEPKGLNQLISTEKLISELPEKVEVVIADNQADLRIIEKILVPDQLPRLAFSSSSENKVENDPLFKEKELSTKFSSQFYADAGGLASSSGLPSGFRLGLGWQKDLGRKISFGTGLNYRFQRWRVNNAEDGNAVAGVRVEAAGESTFLGAGGGTTIPVEVIKERSFELPLVLQMKLDKRWQIGLGAYASYSVGSFAGLLNNNSALFNLDAGTPNGGNDPNTNFDLDELAALNSSANNWYRASTGTRIEPTQLNRFQFGTIVSAQYRFAKRWSVQAHGQFAIRPPVEKSILQTDPLFLGVGVRYHWK